MTNAFVKEFSRKKLSLNFVEGEEASIYKSSIFPPWVLLLLRLVMAMFCITITIISGVRQGDAKWFIFLTNWGLLCLTMSMVGLTLVSVIRLTKQGTNDSRRKQQLDDDERNASQVTESLSWFEKIVWVLWILAANGAVVVSINYWALVFEPPTNFMDIAVHTMNSVIILVQLFLGRIPVRMWQGLYVVIFAVVYGLFTVVYWAAGGKDDKGNPFIYEALDYENGEPGVVAGALLGTVFVLTPCVQLILFGLYQISRLFYRRRNMQFL